VPIIQLMSPIMLMALPIFIRLGETVLQVVTTQCTRFATQCSSLALRHGVAHCSTVRPLQHGAAALQHGDTLQHGCNA
jgi:hypothetical protein